MIFFLLYFTGLGIRLHYLFDVWKSWSSLTPNPWCRQGFHSASWNIEWHSTLNWETQWLPFVTCSDLTFKLTMKSDCSMRHTHAEKILLVQYVEDVKDLAKTPGTILTLNINQNKLAVTKLEAMQLPPLLQMTGAVTGTRTWLIKYNYV